MSEERDKKDKKEVVEQENSASTSRKRGNTRLRGSECWEKKL